VAGPLNDRDTLTVRHIAASQLDNSNFVIFTAVLLNRAMWAKPCRNKLASTLVAVSVIVSVIVLSSRHRSSLRFVVLRNSSSDAVITRCDFVRFDVPRTGNRLGNQLFYFAAVQHVAWLTGRTPGIRGRGVREWLSTFPFPPIPIYSIPIPSHPHAQVFLTYSHSHGIPVWDIPMPSHSQSVNA